jgi:hypothetical protein
VEVGVHAVLAKVCRRDEAMDHSSVSLEAMIEERRSRKSRMRRNVERIWGGRTKGYALLLATRHTEAEEEVLVADDVLGLAADLQMSVSGVL